MPLFRITYYPLVLLVLCLWGGTLSVHAGEHSPLTSSDLQAVRLFVQWQPQTQFAGLIMAREKGFFRAHGLDVRFIWANAGDSPLEALANKDVECATGWLSEAMAARGKGAQIVNIMQLHQRCAALLVAHKNIHEPPELNGKTIQSWGGELQTDLELFLHRNHITPAKILPLSTSMAPFLTGLVSAMQAMDFNEYFKLIGRGIRPEELRVFSMADYGVDVPGDGLYVHEDLVRTEPETARALRTATLQGWAYALTHEDETVATVMRYIKDKNQPTNRDHQSTMLKLVGDIITWRVGPDPERWGTLDPADFERVRVLLEQAGRPLGDLSYETFFVLP